MVILPTDHHLAALKAISPRDLEGETFVIVSGTAPVLRAVIDNYLKRSGINITPAECYRRLTRQPPLHAGSLIPPSRASRWAF